MSLDPLSQYWLAAALLTAINLLAWASNLILLPGNWIAVFASGLFAYFVHRPDGHGLTWGVVGAALLLAVVGEVLEFVAGAAGASRLGGSRRGILLAMLGTFIGSLVGLTLGIPIPILGSFIGALGGGALGAFAGAYAGELWAGRSNPDSFAVGRAALTGRLVGTGAKLAVGALLVGLITLDLLLN